ncbi:family 16 glycoside hydrolase [Ulvibacterium sp.]|uniref:family 16 glycoside hydrolase n=1 Tax=Ulvibacterium sp. TaxID=2665914 RepID=UPI002620C9E9|nr:family 16 glycoside hydrolase [Ulvibacterium sp.]
MKTNISIALLFIIFLGCKEKPGKTKPQSSKAQVQKFLPFKTIELENLDSFSPTGENWKIAANVYVDRSMERTISFSEGTGVMVNIPKEGSMEHLFTNIEHGDMELEVDVMMPVNSNSGLYFQGRYEIQLFDSWGKKDPEHSDMGGIYQRWDDTREKGKEGFEGHAPKINAAKTPGLWQHFKIIFHAPHFDAAGNKIRNAKFSEVWLNGVLVHKNVEVTGPTRAAAFTDEKPLGPLMVQGDHGPVALKNMRYKLYGTKRVSIQETTMKEFESAGMVLTDMDSLTVIREIETDSISATMATGDRPKKILSYTGKLEIPESGDYLFDYKVNSAGGLFIIDGDTIVDLNGDYNLDSLGLGKKTLAAGEVPFQLIYNKHRAWRRGFSLEVEGPGIEKHALHAESSLNVNEGRPAEDIMVTVSDEVVLHRSFLMHDEIKRTHCISVGTPQGVHYAYDLASGALLKVWDGDFIDATQMWFSRGEKQLGVPSGFTVSFHGDPEFTILAGEDSIWPKTILETENFKPMGYEIGEGGFPTFVYQKTKVDIRDRMVPLEDRRALKRIIEISGETDIWHKIAEGESIVNLPDGSYIINNESYFITVPSNFGLKPIVRNVNGKEELLLKIPAGQNKVEYTIIW